MPKSDTDEHHQGRRRHQNWSPPTLQPDLRAHGHRRAQLLRQPLAIGLTRLGMPCAGAHHRPYQRRGNLRTETLQ
jgi:hypothetical protein